MQKFKPTDFLVFGDHAIFNFKRKRWFASRMCEIVVAYSPLQRKIEIKQYWFHPRYRELNEALDRELGKPVMPEKHERTWLGKGPPDPIKSRRMPEPANEYGAIIRNEYAQETMREYYPHQFLAEYLPVPETTLEPIGEDITEARTTFRKAIHVQF